MLMTTLPACTRLTRQDRSANENPAPTAKSNCPWLCTIRSQRGIGEMSCCTTVQIFVELSRWGADA